VDPGVLYVADGPVITSAGTAAGIDACLHLLRLEHGAAVANAVARRRYGTTPQAYRRTFSLNR
jgi:transcriptional regulator GlxA family with amidase domain